MPSHYSRFNGNLQFFHKMLVSFSFCNIIHKDINVLYYVKMLFPSLKSKSQQLLDFFPQGVDIPWESRCMNLYELCMKFVWIPLHTVCSIYNSSDKSKCYFSWAKTLSVQILCHPYWYDYIGNFLITVGSSL